MLVQAVTAPDPGSTWDLNGVDKANSVMVLKGTWLYSGGLKAEVLQRGLARLLSHYPHLAGRAEGLSIRLDNQGAPFTHHSAPRLSLDQLVATPGKAHALHTFKAGPARKGRVAPFEAQLVDLSDGQALCITASHSMLDGLAFYTLAQRWGQICRGETIELPLIDQGRLPTAPQRTKAEVKAQALAQGWRGFALAALPALAKLILGRLKNRSQPYHLDDEALARILERARAGAPDGVRIGANDALTAHLTGLWARLCHPPGTEVGQVVVLDGRRHLEGVPLAFAGNAAMSVPGARFSAGASLPEVALATHQALEPWLAKPSAAMTAHWRLSLELTHHGVFMSFFDIGATYARRPTVLYMNNFSRMPIYEVDFGSGPPVRVIPHDLPDAILVWPTPPGQGGVEVYLAGVLDRASKAWGDEVWWVELKTGREPVHT